MSLTVMAMALAMAGQAPKPAPRTISPNFLPMEIRKAVDEVNSECKDAGGKPGKSSKLIKFIDLNGDGVIDYLMDRAYYECEGAAGAVSAGQSGNAVTIFVGAPGNTAKKAYQAVSPGVDVEAKDGAPKVYVGVMGPDCGQKNADKLPMSKVAVCQRPLKYNAGKQTFELGPLAEKRPFKLD